MNKTVKTSLIIIGVLGAIIVITYFSINSKSKVTPPEAPGLPEYDKEYKYCCPKPCGSIANKCYRKSDGSKTKCPPSGTTLGNPEDYKYGCNS